MDDEKTLFIIRGLPGSGKTTLATFMVNSLFRCIEQVGDNEGIAISADDFFYNNVGNPGEYNYDKELQEMAHENAHGRCVHAMNVAKVKYIFIHNTFSQPWEVQEYLALANHYGYNVFIIETQNKFQNVHEVPQRVIDTMRARWLPLT